MNRVVTILNKARKAYVEAREAYNKAKTPENWEAYYKAGGVYDMACRARYEPPLLMSK